jgi:hypothetical protein
MRVHPYLRVDGHSLDDASSTSSSCACAADAHEPKRSQTRSFIHANGFTLISSISLITNIFLISHFTVRCNFCAPRTAPRHLLPSLIPPLPRYAVAASIPIAYHFFCALFFCQSFNSCCRLLSYIGELSRTNVLLSQSELSYEYRRPPSHAHASSSDKRQQHSSKQQRHHKQSVDVKFPLIHFDCALAPAAAGRAASFSLFHSSYHCARRRRSAGVCAGDQSHALIAIVARCSL